MLTEGINNQKTCVNWPPQQCVGGPLPPQCVYPPSPPPARGSHPNPPGVDAAYSSSFSTPDSLQESLMLLLYSPVGAKLVPRRVIVACAGQVPPRLAVMPKYIKFGGIIPNYTLPCSSHMPLPFPSPSAATFLWTGPAPVQLQVKAWPWIRPGIGL